MGDVPAGWERHGIESDITFFAIQLVFVVIVGFLFTTASNEVVREVIMWTMFPSWLVWLLLIIRGLVLVLKRDLVDYRDGIDRAVKVTNKEVLRPPTGLLERLIVTGPRQMLDVKMFIERVEYLMPELTLFKSGKSAYIGNPYAIYVIPGVERGRVELEMIPAARSLIIKIGRDAFSILDRMNGLVEEMEDNEDVPADP